MKDEYGYNGKKPRKSGAFGKFVVKYNKIGWVLLIVLALYLGRGTLSRTINTFRNWEDIQEAKGDVILMQRLFNADRFYLEDPAEYSDVVVLENGTYSHNLRVGSDITLEQEKFEFENGDVFRHVTLPYVDTLDILDVDKLGLDAGDRSILLMMIEKFGGGPVGLDTLAEALGEDPGTLEDVYEPYLLMNGLIMRTPKGRIATENAYRHLGILMPGQE